LIAIDLSWCFNGPETVQSGTSTKFLKISAQFYQTPFPYSVALQIMNKAWINLLKIAGLIIGEFCILRTGAAAASFPAGQDTDTTTKTSEFNGLSADLNNAQQRNQPPDSFTVRLNI
jgi:hypothetical protein